MDAIFVQKAVLLLARERLRQIRDLLTRKGTRRIQLEDDVLALASFAYAKLSLAPGPPEEFMGDAFFTTLPRESVSRYAVLGSLGPSMGRHVATGSPVATWLVDLMHKGNIDEHREAVGAGSTRFVLAMWERILAKVSSPPTAEQLGWLEQMRAYLLGHLCHIATDVVANPYINDLEWHFGTPGSPPTKLTREQILAALDEEAGQRLLADGAQRFRIKWSEWWPASQPDLRDDFFTAYVEAVNSTYLAGGRAFGFGEAQDLFTANEPPELTGAMLRKSYETKQSELALDYEWGYWGWFGALTPIFLPMMFIPAIVHKTEQGKLFFLPANTPGRDEERASFQITALPYSTLSFVAPLYTIILAFFVGRGATLEAGLGIFLSLVMTLAGIFYYVTSFKQNDTSPSGSRWFLLFVGPLILQVAYIVMSGIRSGAFRSQGDKFSKLYFYFFFCHLFMSMMALVLLRLPGVGEELGQGPKNADGSENGWWWLVMIIWSLVCLIFWFLAPLFIERNSRDIPRSFPHYIRAFDESTLGYTPQDLPGGPTAPTGAAPLARRYYPSGKRKLAKLWWTGPGEMWVRSRRDRLEFSRTNGGALYATVLAPVAPMTLKEVIDVMGRTVVDGTGKVEAKAFYEAELAFELSPGETFWDHGDDAFTHVEHDNESAQFKKLQGTEAASDYTLFHAPKARFAVRMGRNGPARVDEDRRTSATGEGRIRGAGNVIRGGTAAEQTRFMGIFRPGDVITSGGNSVTVVEVHSDTELVTNIALAGLPAFAAAAGVAYDRGAQDPDRSQDFRGPGTITVDIDGTDRDKDTTDALPRVTITGGGFGAVFVPGDIIRAYLPGETDKSKGHERIVMTVQSGSLTTDRPLPKAILDCVYDRVGQETVDGHPFLGGVDHDVFAGDSILDYAADLAAILCMGGASHLMNDAERNANGAGRIQRVARVFRDWNLDRRRINEWRMVVSGGAMSEKSGHPELADSLQPTVSGWTSRAERGEPHSNTLGWVPLISKWLDLARRPGVDLRAAAPNGPGELDNLDISRGVAFLFDLADPVP